MTRLIIALLLLSNAVWIAIDFGLKREIETSDNNYIRQLKSTNECLHLDEMTKDSITLWNGYFFIDDSITADNHGLIIPAKVKVEKMGNIQLKGDGILIAGFGFKSRGPLPVYKYAHIALDAYYLEANRRINNAENWSKDKERNDYVIVGGLVEYPTK